MRIRRSTLVWLMAPPVLAVAAAYAQWALAGLPPMPMPPASHGGPYGFPLWLRLGHYLNFFLLVLLVRSGLQVLADHPRLYWNIHCTPGTEWARFTPVEVPVDRVWTSKDDTRHLSPWIGLPGGKHTVGLARNWHFASVILWVGNGVLFYVLLFTTGQWRRIVPTSWRVVPDAWAVFVHYATLHFQQEPNTFYAYNPLQQLAYFAAVFVLAPLSIVTGPSMSPALVNRLRGSPRIRGNRQIGRSIHFIVTCAWLAFIAVHVTFVAITGIARNMNHIVLGTDGGRALGLVLGGVGIVGIVAASALANWLSWHRPRAVQHATAGIIDPLLALTLDRDAPRSEYLKKDISPYFWPNGKLPATDEWKALAADQFRDYRLEVYGLVEKPMSFTLEDLRALRKETHITLHHCIQGWSGIAAWGGLPMPDLLKLVRPMPRARAVVFFSFEEEHGRPYYESAPLQTVLHPQTLLAYEMNFAPLTELHGAPLRLRIENQLGFKMVKWIHAIEVVENVRSICAGEGGYHEDNEFFNTMADI